MAITLDGSNVNTTGLINSGTTKATTSGTSIEFTSIPAGTRRITVMFNGCSTSGASPPLVQIGSGSYATSGYTAYYYAAGFPAGATQTAGFLWGSGNGSNLVYGHLFLTHMGSNIWISSTNVAIFDGTTRSNQNGGGTITLGGTLDRLRLMAQNGTDTFDAGSVNILYE